MPLNNSSKTERFEEQATRKLNLVKIERKKRNFTTKKKMLERKDRRSSNAYRERMLAKIGKKIKNRKADAHNENEEIKPREYHIHVSTNPSTRDLMKTTKANQIRKATKTSRNIQLLKRRYFSCHHPKKKKIKMTKYEQDQREGSNDRQTTGQTGEILPFSNRIRAHGLLYPVPCSDR